MTKYAGIDLTGHRYGRWLVESFYSESIPKHRMWNCICECGTRRVVNAKNLKAGKSKSCGCLKSELIHKRLFKGGEERTGSSEYKSWCMMIQRCTSTTNQDYKHYGGRGITVFEEWRKSFDKFLEYMGKKPSREYSIERIDHNGNYEPGNVTWIHKSKQPLNSRRNNMITWNGKTQCLSEWAKETGLDYHTLQSRVHRFGWKPPELFKKPKKMGNGADYRKKMFSSRNENSEDL